MIIGRLRHMGLGNTPEGLRGASEWDTVPCVSSGTPDQRVCMERSKLYLLWQIWEWRMWAEQGEMGFLPPIPCVLAFVWYTYLLPSACLNVTHPPKPSQNSFTPFSLLLVLNVSSEVGTLSSRSNCSMGAGVCSFYFPGQSSGSNPFVLCWEARAQRGQGLQ